MTGALLAVGIVITSSLSGLACIAKPDVIKDELPICRDAKYIAYAFHASKDKIPETVISMGLASCKNQQTFIFCKEQTADIVDENKHKDAFQSCWDKAKTQ